MTKKPTPLLLSPPPPPKSIVSLARANGPKHGRRTKMLQQRNRKRTSIFRTDTTTKSANRFDDLFCISWMLSLHFYTINPLLKIQLVYKSSKEVFGQYPSLTSRLVNNRRAITHRYCLIKPISGWRHPRKCHSSRMLLSYMTFQRF